MAEHLAEYSKVISKRYGRQAPRPVSTSFSQLVKLGLLPEAKQYEGLFSDLGGQPPA